MTSSVTYRGFTFDNRTSPLLKSLDGLAGWAGRGGVFPMGADHGATVGPVLADGKEFQLVFQLLGNDYATRWSERSEVRQAFNAADDTEDAMVINWDGWPAVQIACKPRSRGGEMGPLTPLMPVRLVASDPVLYGTTLFETSVPVFVGSGGVTFPATFPKDFGASGSGSSANVPNDGDHITWPRFVITGPSSGTCQPLKIENVTTGEEINFTADGGLTIASGSTLIVEAHPHRRTVTFTDGASRWNTVAGTEWWPILPGGADLRFRCSGTTAGVTLIAQTRAAYL